MTIEMAQRDVDLSRQRVKLAEEHLQHLVVDRAAFVDGDEQLAGVAAPDARVDVGVATVDPLDRRRSFTPDDVADELTKNVAPVDDVGNRASDLDPQLGGNVAPALGLVVSGPYGTFDDG